MAEKPIAIPKGYHTVSPHLIVPDAAKAIEFYQHAFGAEEVMRAPYPDGRGIMHAEIRIGNSVVMLGEENAQTGCKSPLTLGGTPVSFFVYVENVDALFQRAINAGATVQMPLMDMFWGDRMGQIGDPFGHKWSLAQHIKDLTGEQITKARDEFLAQMKKK